MGHIKHLDDPKPIFDPKPVLDPKPIFDPKHHHDPKPIYDPKQIFDPPINIKKILDDIQYQLPPDRIGPVKFDAIEGLLPFILQFAHQYNATNLSKEDAFKASMEMYDAAIKQAQYQIDMLKAHVESLTKQRDDFKKSSESSK